MIEGKGWFTKYFSGLCEGLSLAEVAVEVVQDAQGRPVYPPEAFVEDLTRLVWAGFDGSIHPDLGRIQIAYRIPPSDPHVREWKISCSLGEAFFTFPL